MPLRPALSAFHPRSPKPREPRQVHCPHCGTSFSISKRAMSARCPGCTRPLAFEDLNLSGKVDGDISTMGQVQIEEQAQVSGRLVCGDLQLDGRFEGSMVVYGEINMTAQSSASGKLIGKSLKVPAGGAFRGSVKIEPKPKVMPQVATAFHRQPIQKPTRSVNHAASPNTRASQSGFPGLLSPAANTR